jgi:hypothetical protein
MAVKGYSGVSKVRVSPEYGIYDDAKGVLVRFGGKHEQLCKAPLNPYEALCDNVGLIL